jgi:ABC-2 type transport system ATP-binding protein
MEEVIIRVEGLHKRYGASGPEAVAGIDFEIRRGEIFGLLGPNGAGKTTTIGTITTRVRPTGGIRVAGSARVRAPGGRLSAAAALNRRR